jgi:hypothetical protein
VSDPALDAREVLTSTPHDWAAIRYSGDTEQKLEILRGDERLPVGTFASGLTLDGEWVGDVLFYSVGDAELHAVTVGDAGVTDTLLSDTGQSGFACQDDGHPPGKVAVRFEGSPSGLLLVDVTGPAASVARTVLASDADALPDCPVWDPNGHGLAYVEQSDAGSTVFVVGWGEAGPGEPVLAQSADVTLELVNARLPAE